MQENLNIYLIIFFISFILFFAGVIALFVQYRTKKINNLRQQQINEERHNQELLTTQLEIQTQTMQHIGREIHDSVGQKLTLASLYTQQLAYENKAPQVTGKIENISSIINESLQELRQLSKSLTDDAIAGKSINELIEEECKKVNDLQKCSVAYSLPENAVVLPYQAKNILVRVLQEFMQNSIKHSGCKKIKAELTKTENAVTLFLSDDGTGFNNVVKNSKGIGLANMEKRIALLHGSFTLRSSSSGTNLTAKIPA